MASVSLDGRKLTDLHAFHRECQLVFGLPDFYGRNVSALIDCLSGVRDSDGMSRFVLAADEVLEIELNDASIVGHEAPAVLAALEDAVDEVNLRHVEAGAMPPLRLVLR
jgi:hypothetical protein